LDRGVIYSHGAKVGGHGLGLVAYQELKALYDAGLLQRGIGAYGDASDFADADMRLFPWMRGMFYLLRDRPRLRDAIYDGFAARYVEPCTIFHGWSGQCLRSARRAKALGAKIVVELGQSHWRAMDDVLSDEFAKRGLPYRRVPPRSAARYDAEYSLADRIIVQSSNSRDSLVQAGYAREKVVVTVRAAASHTFYPAESPPDRFRVLFAGMVGLRKGVPYLLEAWDALQLPEAELWLAGRVLPDGEPWAKAYADRSDVRFLGYVDDMPALYRQASIVALPSLSEGSPKALAEAMASGLPIIYTPNCGAVARDGVEGIEVPIQDADAVAAAIERLYRDPGLRHAMGRAGVALMQRYTWERARERWLAVHRALLGEGA
jgi:alpha-maltose-1-phosphate synthase